MYSDLLRLIKQSAKDAIENDNPMVLQAGTVIQVSPLHIKADNSIIHKEERGDLILTHLVKDYEVDITVKHSVENIDKIENKKYTKPGKAETPVIPMGDLTEHNHTYEGRKKIIIHLALTLGEKVLLLRENGGQRYIVLDRVYDPVTEGEWL